MTNDEVLLIELGNKLLQCERKSLIAKIKLDAFKAGAEWAANLADNHNEFGVCCGTGIKEEITNQVRALEELPK